MWAALRLFGRQPVTHGLTRRGGSGLRFFCQNSSVPSDVAALMSAKPSQALLDRSIVTSLPAILAKIGVNFNSDAARNTVWLSDVLKVQSPSLYQRVIVGGEHPSNQNWLEEAEAHWVTTNGVTGLCAQLEQEYGALQLDENGIVDTNALPAVFAEGNGKFLSERVLRVLSSLVANEFQTRCYEYQGDGAPTEGDHARQALALMSMHTQGSPIGVRLPSVLGAGLHDVGRWLTANREEQHANHDTLGAGLIGVLGASAARWPGLHVYGKHFLNAVSFFDAVPLSPESQASLVIQQKPQQLGALRHKFQGMSDEDKITNAALAMLFKAMVDDVAKMPTHLCPTISQISQVDVMRLVSWRLYLQQRNLLFQCRQAPQHALDLFATNCCQLFRLLQHGGYDCQAAGVDDQGVLGLVAAIDETDFTSDDWLQQLRENTEAPSNRPACR